MDFGGMTDYNLSATFLLISMAARVQLETDSFLDWDDDAEDLAGGNISDPLPGIKRKEAVSLNMAMMIDALKLLCDDKWPFRQNTSGEWVWASISEDLIGDYMECLSEEIEEEDMKYQFPAFRVLRLLGRVSIKDALTAHNDGELEIAFYSAWREAMDCGDGYGVCQMFYPHAHSDEMNQMMSQPIGRIKAEFDFCFNEIVEWFDNTIKPFPFDRVTGEALKRSKLEYKKQQAAARKARQLKDKPKPASRRLDPELYLYLMKCGHTGHYKIGISKTPKKRESTLQSEKPSITMVGAWKGSGFYERPWHQYFKDQRLRGEWFSLSPAQVRFFTSTCEKGNAAMNNLLLGGKSDWAA